MKLTNSLLTTVFATALTTLALAGCGSESSGSGGSGGTGGSDTGTSTTTAGATPLTAKDLAGEWVSKGCEAYPNGQGGENYLTRDFTLTESTWDLSFSIFGDKDCTVPLFTSKIHGPYTLGALSAKVEGATEGQFGFETNEWTAHTADMAAAFTGAGCGSMPWEVDVPQDVTQTGCIGVARKVSECPQEYDVVSLDGDALSFGQRITDMCKEDGRPTALSAYAVYKK